MTHIAGSGDDALRAGTAILNRFCDDLRGKPSLLLLVPAAGGLDGQKVTLLNPVTKLYWNLLGKRTGDFLDDFDLLVIGVR